MKEIGKFRKKPVVIEAFRFQGCKPAINIVAADILKSCEYRYAGDSLFIKTLEGEMRADPGDWIIRGVKGEVYPCKDDVFQATYEEAE